MWKRLLSVIFLFSCPLLAEQTKTTYNPFTGKLDYITALTTSSIVAGSGVTTSCTSGACTITASGGGGGSSSLQVNQSGVQISSPTASLNFLGPPFKLTTITGTTAQIALDPSSATLQGNLYSISGIAASTGTLSANVVSIGLSTAAIASSTGSISVTLVSVGASTAAIAASTGTISATLVSVGASTAAIAASTGTINTSLVAVAVSTGALYITTATLTTQVNNLNTSTGTLNTKIDTKVNYSSFSATSPITYNSATGAIGATQISLSSGVMNVLPTANMVSTAAFTVSTQTFSAAQTFTSSFTVNGGSIIINGVQYSFPSTGTIGNYLQYVTTNTLQWGFASTTSGAASSSSSGTIIQVISSNTVSAFSTTNTGFTNTYLAATITPKSASNIIVIHVAGPLSNASAAAAASATIAKGLTNIMGSNGQCSESGLAAAAVSCSMVWVDTGPLTTAATTYTVQVLTNNGAFATTWGATNQSQSLILEEINPTGGIIGGVNSGTAGQLSYFASAGTTISGATGTFVTGSSVTFTIPVLVSSSMTISSTTYIAGSTLTYQNGGMMSIKQINWFDGTVQVSSPGVSGGATPGGVLGNVQYNNPVGTLAGAASFNVWASSVVVSNNYNLVAPTMTYTVIANSTSPTKTANYTMTPADSVIFASAPINVNNMIITLPTASQALNQSVTIYRADVSTRSVQVQAAGTDLISGTTSAFFLPAKGQSITMQSDGVSNWWASHTPMTPGVMGNIAIPNSALAVAASSAYCFPFNVPDFVYVATMSWENGAAAGNYDIGIYDTEDVNGVSKLLVSSGTTATPALGYHGVNFVAKNVILHPGSMWYCIGSTNTTTTINRFSTSDSLGPSCVFASSIPLPATLTMKGCTRTVGSAYAVGIVGVGNPGWQ